uniref:MH2 domain-containing protein n=1 Tax=Glossina brevipalpis TaxID=37001 RepID=A0A1A9W6X4_9MUSC
MISNKPRSTSMKGHQRKVEHIQEVLDKWTQIDDEIWAKVIVFERNRRVAKAYARAPILDLVTIIWSIIYALNCNKKQLTIAYNK